MNRRLVVRLIAANLLAASLLQAEPAAKITMPKSSDPRHGFTLVSYYSSHEKDASGKTMTAIYMAELSRRLVVVRLLRQTPDSAARG